MKTDRILSGLFAAIIATVTSLGFTAKAQTTVVTNNGVTARVWVAVAPNTSSADYVPYATRVRDWVTAGAPTNSTPPQIKDSIVAGDVISSSIDSSGRRVHFPLMIEGQKKLSINGISWVIRSSDPFNALKYEGNLAGLSYDPITRTGTDFGPDNIRGGGNDVIRNNETGSNPVNSLFYVGAGNGFRGNNPDEIAQATAFFNANRPFGITITYHITFVDGTSMDVGATVDSFGKPTLSWNRQGTNQVFSVVATGDSTGVVLNLQSAPQLSASPAWTTIANWNPGQPLTRPIDTAKPTEFFRVIRP